MSSKTSAENLKDSSAAANAARPVAVFRCGRWCVDAEQRVLFLDGAPVALAPRDFDLLVVLIENAGRVVSKDELLKRVWGPVIVEEGNLASHVSVLRAVLAQGDSALRYIDTVPKRGYRFAAALDALAEVAAQPTAPEPPNVLPEVVASPAPPARRPTPPWRARALAAVIALVALASLARWWVTDEPSLPFSQRDWLLVADFENQTGEARFDTALLTALTVSLEQSEYVNVYPRSRVAGALARMQRPADARLDEVTAREICSRDNVRALVTASIARTGTQYALAARLVDPATGTAIRSYLRQVPNESGLLASLQEIGSELRKDLGESLSGIAAADRPLAEVTTPKLDALRLYSEGQRFWEQARFEQAAEAYRSAVAADPEFAMAHAALGRAYYSYAFNRIDLGQEHYQRALALAARTTAREGLLIEAGFAAARRDAPRAIELYQRYLALYPRDPVGHQSLGQVYLDAGRLDDAVVSLQVVLREDPANAKVLNNAAIAYAKLDRFDEAVPLFERAIQADAGFLDRHNFRFNYATILFAAGERERAREIMLVATRQQGEQDRAWRALGLYAQFEGRYTQAADYYTKAIAAADGNRSSDASLSRSRNHGYLAAVLATRGERAAALRELDAAIVALDAHGDAPVNFRVRLAVAYANLGALANASAQLAKVTPGSPGPTTNDWAPQVVAAAIAVARGDARTAVPLLERALSGSGDGSDRLLVQYALAHALRAAGESDRALDAYQTLASLPRGQWIGWEAQEMQQLAVLELARLLAERGEVQHAREALARVQDYWRAADPDLQPAREAAHLAAQLASSDTAGAPERLAAVPRSAPARVQTTSD